MKVAFLVNDLQLSGGLSVVIQHARRLSEIDGWDISLVLVRDEPFASWRGYEELPDLHVISRADALVERYDVAVATWWETTFSLFEIPAARYAYFVQSLEDRFYHHGAPERLGAGLTIDLPVAFITEARWIADTLGALRPDAPCYLVRNGIDKDVFAVPDAITPQLSDPLRVLIEGSPHSWFKHVGAAIAAAGHMQEPHQLTVVTSDRGALGEVEVDEVLGPLSHREIADVYKRTDVLVKLSSVEGMFGPPLEGFHGGATCVVTPVTGHEEYVEHGFNGLVTDWDDLRGTARQLDLLARDRGLLHFLRSNALETARAWPSWEQASQFMAAALVAIRREPQLSEPAGAARLLADLRGDLELYEGQIRERAQLSRVTLRVDALVRRLQQNAKLMRLVALRHNRFARIAARPLRPIYRRMRRSLS